MQSPDPIWLVANWKMNGTTAEVQAYSHQINATLADLGGHVRAIFCPPTGYLSTARQSLPLNARLQLGAQDCHAKAKGAYTGETSAPMLADLGARYVILGHSERRARGETDNDVAAKAEAALAAGLTPILCVGEPEEVYRAKQTAPYLERQLAAFDKIREANFLVAYEPLWAIGSGRTPEHLEIEAAHTHIKTVLGSGKTVLYGGSVKAENAQEILRLPGVSGALIGSASLEIVNMRAIVAAAVGS